MTKEIIACPYCQAELTVEEQDSSCTCDHCGRELQALAQCAFARGLRSFEEGQRILEAALERTRQPLYERDGIAAVRSLQRAHSALMVAFRYELPDPQRERAVGMMAEISHLFGRRGIISPPERSYWSAVALEQHCLQELDALQARQESPGRGVRERLAWLRSRLRRRRLGATLARLQRQLDMLEQIIAFADRPHARRPTEARR